jgi:hypothetical protein
MAAIYEATGLAINVSRPVVQDGEFVVSLKDAIQSYSHDISSESGFDRATITFTVRRDEVSRWLHRGLGMDIDVRDRSGAQVWNGFVDQVSVNEGARRTSVGRLTEVANRVAVSYALVIPDTDEPVIGEQTITADADNTDSQDRYGIWEKVVSGGARTETEALQIRDVVLAKYAYPTTSYDISAAGDVSVTLNCYGYHRWLDAFTYANSDNDEVTTSAKVELVLGDEASTNGVLSTDYSVVDTSSAYVTTFEDGTRTGWTIIKECAAFGDTDDNIWIFGIYEDRRAMFQVVPDTIEYVHRRGIGPVVERLSGGVVSPWTVRAGRWLFMPDIILGGEEWPIPTTRAELYEDRRVAFIERVTYNAPDGFSVQGTRVAKGSQRLARWGLGSL